MEYALPSLVMKTDTVGVFVPSLDENSVDVCLDRDYACVVSELAVSSSHYPHHISSMTSTMSNLGLSLFAVLKLCSF